MLAKDLLPPNVVTLVLVEAAPWIAAETWSSVEGYTTAAGTGAMREFQTWESSDQVEFDEREKVTFAEARHPKRVVRLVSKSSGKATVLAEVKVAKTPSRRATRNFVDTMRSSSE